MNSALLIPIKDRNNEEERALIAAVRKYWTHTPFKFITQEEFDVMRKTKVKNPNRVYLIKETYERLKYSRKDWAYTKYYLTTELGGIEVLDAPYIEFKLPVKTENKEVKNPDYGFLYGLMMKQLNYDINLMADKKNYSSIKRETLIKANFKRDLKKYAGKEILVSQTDLDNYMMNLPDGKKNAKQKEKFLKYISKKTKTEVSKIKFVPEDEIKKAVSYSKSDALVYTGFTVYDTEDGKMLRRIDPHTGKRKVNAVFTVFLSLVIIAVAALFLFS